MVVIVTVTNGVRSKNFKVETAAGLIPSVQIEFGVGTITDPDGMALTAEYGNLEEGVYIWSTGASVPHVKLTKRGVLATQLPEPDADKDPDPDAFEGRSQAFRVFPAGGVVLWEMAPDGQSTLKEAITQFAAVSDNTRKRYDSFPAVGRVGGKEVRPHHAMDLVAVRTLDEMLPSVQDSKMGWISECQIEQLEALGGSLATYMSAESMPRYIQREPAATRSTGRGTLTTGRLRSDFALVLDRSSKKAKPTTRPSSSNATKVDTSTTMRAVEIPSSRAARATSRSARSDSGPPPSTLAGARARATRSAASGVANSSKGEGDGKTVSLSRKEVNAAWQAWLKAAKGYLLVSEIKRISKLVRSGLPVELLVEYSKQPIDSLSRSVHAMLDQLWTYMVVTGVEFSWLSCYLFTWIGWRSPKDPTRLHLSVPICHATDGRNGGVTTLAALAWLQDQALIRMDERNHDRSTTTAAMAHYGEEDHDDDAGPDLKDDGELSPDSNDSSFGPKEKKRKRSSSRKGGKKSKKANNTLACVDVPLLRASMLCPLGERVGEGSTCVVRLADYNGKEAAVKMLLRGLQPYEAVLREATMYMVLKPLQGSVIPRLFGAGRLAFGTPFLATSFVHGTSLSMLQDIPQAVRNAACSSLSSIHALGVAHGDVGLNNLLLVMTDDSMERGLPAIRTTGRCRGGDGEPCPPSAVKHVSVVVLDLGKAYVCHDREELTREMESFERLLR